MDRTGNKNMVPTSLKCSVSRFNSFLSNSIEKMGLVNQRRPYGMKYCILRAVGAPHSQHDHDLIIENSVSAIPNSDLSSVEYLKKSRRMLFGRGLPMPRICSRTSSSVRVLARNTAGTGQSKVTGDTDEGGMTHPIKAVMIDPADAPLMTRGIKF